MFQELRTATVLLVALTVLTGGLYPLAVTAIAQLAFPHQAGGSLIDGEGRLAGSELVGQPFASERYFWGRLSATSPVPGNAAASSGSNFGPLHPGLKEAVEARIAALRRNGAAPRDAAIPVDLVTASGSGLDPHISPAAAEFQVPRVAASRKMSEEDVRAIVRLHTENRQWGVLGEPRVHVLRLNLALDQHRPQ